MDVKIKKFKINKWSPVALLIVLLILCFIYFENPQLPVDLTSRPPTSIASQPGAVSSAPVKAPEPSQSAQAVPPPSGSMPAVEPQKEAATKSSTSNVKTTGSDKDLSVGLNDPRTQRLNDTIGLTDPPTQRLNDSIGLTNPTTHDPKTQRHRGLNDSTTRQRLDPRVQSKIHSESGHSRFTRKTRGQIARTETSFSNNLLLSRRGGSQTILRELHENICSERCRCLYALSPPSRTKQGGRTGRNQKYIHAVFQAE